MTNTESLTLSYATVTYVILEKNATKTARWLDLEGAEKFAAMLTAQPERYTVTEVQEVSTTYRVGDAVTVRAFGADRPGHVTKLGRTKVTVKFYSNGAQTRLSTRAVGVTEVSPA